jgi:hypothetical protein
MEQLSARGNTQAFFESLKTIYGPTQSKTIAQQFKKKDGSLTKSISESLERLREYYSELLNRNISIAPEVDSYVALFTKPVNLNLDVMPTYDEYIKAVQRAKNHKSGTDYISIDLLKYSSSKHLNLAVYQIIARIWETVEIPNSFLQLILCSIPKKGDASICENHRGISLISHTSKVLTLLINARMYSYVEEQLILPESQCGFRKGRTSAEALLI